MKFEVDVNKKSFFFIAFLVAFIVLGIFAYAYNNPAVGGNPAVFGHSADEIKGVCLTNGSGCPASASGSNIVGTLVYDKPGVYNVTVPEGVRSVQVQAVGGGGAGGPAWFYNNVDTSTGSGGGAGAYSRATFSVSPGFIGSVIIGGGGDILLTSKGACAFSWDGGSICSDNNRGVSGNTTSFVDKNGQVKVKALGGQGGGAYPSTWEGQCSGGFIGIGGSAALGIGDIKISGQDGTSSGGTTIPTVGGANPTFSFTGHGGAGGGSGSNGNGWYCPNAGVDGAAVIIMYS